MARHCRLQRRKDYRRALHPPGLFHAHLTASIRRATVAKVITFFRCRSRRLRHKFISQWSALLLKVLITLYFFKRLSHFLRHCLGVALHLQWFICKWVRYSNYFNTIPHVDWVYNKRFYVQLLLSNIQHSVLIACNQICSTCALIPHMSQTNTRITEIAYQASLEPTIKCHALESTHNNSDLMKHQSHGLVLHCHQVLCILGSL